MGYVEDTLGPGERVIRAARYHWLYTVGALFQPLLLLAGAALLYFGGLRLLAGAERPPGDGWVEIVLAVAAGVLALIAVLAFLRAMLEKWTTEIAITDRRLVYKHGWIARHSQELPVSRLEEVNLEQSVFGRLFDYGRLTVAGTGGDSALELPEIDDPVGFRQAIAEARGGERGDA